MKLNYMNWNIRDIGHLVVVAIIFVVLIAVMHIFVSPLLTLVLPTVFVAPLTLTEILLFLLLIRLVVKG